MHALDAPQHGFEALNDLLGDGALSREIRGPRERQAREALGGGVSRGARPAVGELVHG